MATFELEETFVVVNANDGWAVLVMPGALSCPETILIDGVPFGYDIERTHQVRKNLRLQMQS